MKNHLTFDSWSMTVRKSAEIIKARGKISDAAEKMEFPYAKRILITTATSDICRIFLKHFPEFDLLVKPEVRPSQKGLSIKIQLPGPHSTNTDEKLTAKNTKLVDILKKEIKTTSSIFDELIPVPENGMAPTLTLIKWNYAQSDET